MVQASETRSTVLCVDDEPLTRKALHRLLRKGNYLLRFAETPQQALEVVEAQSVDLVITDQRMPGMSGVELLREVRKKAPGTAGLLLTAYPESVFEEDPPEAPLFCKPWDDDTLRESIDGMLEERRGKRVGEPRKSAVRTVLVPLDGSIEAELALGSVLPLLEGEPMRLILLEVMPELGLHRNVYAYLEKTRERLSSQGIDTVADVRWGDPAEQLLLHVRHAHADLIVLPLHRRRGLRRFFGSSIAEQILRGTDIPVLVSRPDLAVRSFQNILVPLDGSREAEAALPEAVRMARKTGATIDLVRVESGDMPRDTVPYLAELAGLLGIEEVDAEPWALVGDPVREILRHAQERGTDLVCMTDGNRSGWSRLLSGSVTSKIIRTATCPVFVRKTA